ncbi:TMEM165/GDT1 family protein [Sporanaerobium hydrogeniformans]|uniref:TMEM165/GDT1 family protein n=1 Tax=Sporanaerobium hydrogeniformans TaxID=3072179 RepID=UPI0015D509C3|nr:TMEM165/GDT1 family protein [Sporanaerobium hydrogeniformans]
MLKEMTSAFLLVFMAEMGDKSQLLAMLFASRYSMKEVLAGVFLGVLFNHGLAILIGVTLGNIISISCLSFVSSIAFLYFAFTSLQQEKEENEKKTETYNWPFLIVTTAFFVGELGDKTQLAAVTLGMEASYPLIVLAGTISAMLVVSSLGILIGGKMGKLISPLLIRIFSASLFFVFGMLKLISLLRVKTDFNTMLIIGALLIALFLWTLGEMLHKSKSSSLWIQDESL